MKINVKNSFIVVGITITMLCSSWITASWFGRQVGKVSKQVKKVTKKTSGVTKEAEAAAGKAGKEAKEAAGAAKSKVKALITPKYAKVYLKHAEAVNKGMSRMAKLEKEFGKAGKKLSKKDIAKADQQLKSDLKALDELMKKQSHKGADMPKEAFDRMQGELVELKAFAQKNGLNSSLKKLESIEGKVKTASKDARKTLDKEESRWFEEFQPSKKWSTKKKVIVGAAAVTGVVGVAGVAGVAGSQLMKGDSSTPDTTAEEPAVILDESVPTPTDVTTEGGNVTPDQTVPAVEETIVVE